MTKQEFQKLTEDHVLLLDGATGSNLMKGRHAAWCLHRELGA